MPAFYSDINLNGNALNNWKLEYLLSNPTGLVRGRVFDHATLGPVWFDGTAIRPFDIRKVTDGSIPMSGLATDPLARDNHMGSQLSSTIRDLKQTVTAYRLSEFGAPAANVDWGGNRLTGLGNASAATDAIPFGQVTTLISQAIAGQTAKKNPARMVFTSNITLSGLQNTDSVTGTVDARALVTGQTNAAQNGLYLMKTGAWVRATDADEPAEWTEGTEILILSGTNFGGTVWRLTSAGTVTPGTSPMNFTMVQKINTYTAASQTMTLTGMEFAVKMKADGGLLSDANGIYIDTTKFGRKGEGLISGDGATQQFTVTHNLNNIRPIVGFFDAANNSVGIDWTALDANRIRVTFGAGSIPANGTNYIVSVMG